MAQRFKRHFSERDRDILLLDALLFRQACMQATVKAPPNGTEYLAAKRAMEAVDDLAGALVGDRELFWVKRNVRPHGELLDRLDAMRQERLKKT